MKISSDAKAQDNKGWDNMMQVRIALHYNKFQSEYPKEVKSRDIGLNW